MNILAEEINAIKLSVIIIIKCIKHNINIPRTFLDHQETQLHNVDNNNSVTF